MRRYVKIIVSLFLTMSLFTLFLFTIKVQALNQEQISPILIDSATHHLGDQTIDFFDIPETEGTVFTTTFNLPSTMLQDSFLRLETYNVEGANSIKINGAEIGYLPGTWWLGWQPVVASVPAIVLQEGENTLTIVSENFPTWRLFELWYDDFMVRKIEFLPWQSPFDDEFADPELISGWRFVDLLGDCEYSLTKQPGKLVMDVPGSTTWKNGHDLFWLFNFNAPRLLQPVQGDFMIETDVSMDTKCNYQAAGLLAWQDTWNHVRLERNAWWGGSVYGSLHSISGSPWTYQPIGKKDLQLRMSRIGNTFSGWYRPEGDEDWSVLGQATAPFSETLLVGLTTINQHCGQDVSVAFDYFQISQAVPPIFDYSCGTTNISQPIVEGLATAGSQIQLYVDGALSAISVADLTGSFSITPTIPLLSGPHIITATATQSGETSPASSKLSLTVAPEEPINLLGITVVHAPLIGNDPLITEHLHNKSGCATCDGTGFNMWVPGHKPITVTVPVSTTDISSVEVHMGDHVFELADPDEDNIYEGSFTPPSIRGLASLEFVVRRVGGLVTEYACGEIIIDPYGTVYDVEIGPSAPIAGATVTLYQQNPATKGWSFWTPGEDQQNPITTDSNGQYAFNVPEGTYYISVTAHGYMPYESQPIQVNAESGPVELPIPLTRSLVVTAYIPVVSR